MVRLRNRLRKSLGIGVGAGEIKGSSKRKLGLLKREMITSKCDETSNDRFFTFIDLCLPSLRPEFARTLVFTRETALAGTIWVFLNNGENHTAMEGEVYCPGPQEAAKRAKTGNLRGGWFDALSGKAMNRYLKNGCFEAPDKFPKILYQKNGKEA